MPASAPRFCDVVLPVPVDRNFTYSLPETLRHRVQAGCRVLAPFGSRKLIGVVLRLHNEDPGHEAKQVLRLLHETPALTPELLQLGRWIADYYCAPLGEVLRGMLPLAGESRKDKIVSLTPAGHDAARQFMRSSTPDDPFVQVLRALDQRPLTETYLKKKLPNSQTALQSLRRKGFLTIESVVKDRDPLLARSGRLMIAADNLKAAPEKLTRGERWLVEYLEAHPGPHEIETLTEHRKDVAAVARRLAKSGVVKLWKESEETKAAPAPEAPALILNAAQQAALDAILESLREGVYRTFLLQGVTGSGKTEVYLRAIEKTLDLGRSSLLLVPEIALTPAVASRFFARFGDEVAVLHSAFSGRERSGQWRRVREGKARVVLGTRSGVFAPVPDLGLIVVDEEHDGSYKQDETPRYHGRDVAIVRAREAGATVILGSATPSLESRYNTERGKYQLLELRERIERRPLPHADIVDMRAEFLETKRQDLFSRRLAEGIEHRLEAGEQVILLLNRRGYSTFVACRSCGERIECQNCSVTLTFHRREQRLVCHYCNYVEPVPSKCPKCASDYIYFLGSGSEKVEDQLRERLPKARIARLDSDSVRGREHYETVLNAFREGSYDILTGTQMVAKGHDIPNVTLVGVVSADVGLGMPDFRAAERTFQILTQVAGRAGRGQLPGHVLMQTINPEHYAIRFAAAQDYEGFYQEELKYRRNLRYPPFAAMASMIVRSKKLEEALALSGHLGRHLRDLPEGVFMKGPAAAPVVKLRTEYRYQFLLRARDRKLLSNALRRARAFALDNEWPATALVIDVDPMSLM
jgi:primosomal protein N' (replication factor Y) (superfamily II helicase)